MSNIFQNNLEDLLEEFDPPGDTLNTTGPKHELNNNSTLMIENSNFSLNNTSSA
jgi:hypothetical protein